MRHNHAVIAPTTSQYYDYVPTHAVTPCGSVPTALDPNGVYPYVSFCATDPSPSPRKYTFLVLENQHLKVTICPDLGGKVTSMIHKRSGREVLYVPTAICPVRILPRFYFVAGGIEVSFPISHSPSQNEKVLYRIEYEEDGTHPISHSGDPRSEPQGLKPGSSMNRDGTTEVVPFPSVLTPTSRKGGETGGIPFRTSSAASKSHGLPETASATNSRAYITCGERELRFGMQWSVEYSLGPEDEFLTERVLFHNPGKASYPWMSWSNAALPSAPDTEFHFPRGEVLAHSSRLETIDWERQGPRRESDIHEMTGYFWKTRDANAFGAYTPSLGCGLYHVAAEDAPGMKLWSYGVGEDREWGTLGGAAYIEIQGGPIRDQSVKLELEPGERRVHVEYWWPTDEAMDIYQLNVPDVRLRPAESIPLFEWAREGEVAVWRETVHARETRGALPDPPAVVENRWAPSGMEDLQAAFEWAVESAGNASDLWRFHYGTWLAGRGMTDQAVGVLDACGVGVGKVLLARIYRVRGEVELAARALESTREDWVRLHPQVVVERDQTLRALGRQTLGERERWLDLVPASQDERIVELRVQLLIDQGRIRRARELLLSRSFQKRHQSYTRAGLWKQICEKLGENWEPVPSSLGEDRLAVFGAYREFE